MSACTILFELSYSPFYENASGGVDIAPAREPLAQVSIPIVMFFFCRAFFSNNSTINGAAADDSVQFILLKWFPQNSEDIPLIYLRA